MRPGTSTSVRAMSETTQRTQTRSATPIDNTFLTSLKPYTPYPLYKQKVRSLLKPPDYSRQPPNFLSLRETRTDFEKKEASLQVKLLKKTFNMMREEYNNSYRRMNILNSESIRVSELEHVGTHDIQYLQTHYSELETEEKKMLDKIKDEYTDNINYKHVRERLRQTLMHLELKNQYLQDQIRLKDFLIDSEHRKKIKTLENKFTMVQAYKQTAKTVGLDLKDRTQDLNVLEDDIKVRTKIHELRKTRMKKYEEIAEAAAIEEGDLKSNSIRESLLLHISWAKFLSARLQRLKVKNAPIEEAFKRIKADTTISNPIEIVQKFLMKEERLQTLMLNLTESKRICEKFREKNEMLEKKIDDYMLTQKEGKSMDVTDRKTLIEFKKVKIDNAKIRLNLTQVVYQNIKTWAIKRIKTIETT